jgi:hypothetical protein
LFSCRILAQICQWEQEACNEKDADFIAKLLPVSFLLSVRLYITEVDKLLIQVLVFMRDLLPHSELCLELIMQYIGAEGRRKATRSIDV